jgi:hypothetical protein
VLLESMRFLDTCLLFVYICNAFNVGNIIDGVIVSVLISSVVDRGFELDRVKPKTMN